MRKFLSLFLVLFTLTFTSTCFAETLSDEILAQGKAEADLFLMLKQALGLDWIDEYNAYLSDPIANPAPAWDTSVATLISQGYLSSSFPTDFTIALTGQEVTISRIESQAALREAIAIYLPTMTVSGDVVSLLVQRPAQWVAYETALNGKVDKDGSDDPDILPNASLDFGSNSQINFVSNDGRILGVNSLFYKTQELDNRFVNITGDTMTGVLTATGFKVGSNNVWHQGNDGTGSGLDADLLDGQQGSFYQNASNINAGTLNPARLSGTYGINITGNASTATNANHANNADYATNAGNADTLDGKHESAFAPASHNHGQYVLKAGDTMTGNLSINHNNNPQIKINAPATGSVSSIELTEQTNYGSRMFYDGRDSGDTAAANVIGGLNNGTFNEVMRFKREGGPVIFSTAPKVGTDTVWHAGNDGTGSGLDADLLDGQHGAFYQNASNLNTGVVPAARLSGTYGISISGNAATATNADQLDGYHHDAFVKKVGDTMTGALTAPEYRINDSNTRLIEGANNSVRVQTNYGYTEIGPQNTTAAHFMTDRASFYFNKPVLAESKLQVYNTNTYLTGTEGKIAGNTVWHAGNDGHGKGLDADLLDGKHASEVGFIPNGVQQYSLSGTYTWTKKAGTRYVFVQVVGAGGWGAINSEWGTTFYRGGTSSFGSYLSATGGERFNSPGYGINGDINITGGNGFDWTSTPPTIPVHGGVSALSGFGQGLIITNVYITPRKYYGCAAGGYAAKWIDVSGVTSVTVTVGGPSSGPQTGVVIVEEFK